MSLIVIPFTFSLGAPIIASQHNSNFQTISQDYNGNITDVNIATSAAIADTKLAQITTAGKVSGAAITTLTSIPSGAGILPGANGGIPTGGIIMWSGTIATIPSGYVLCNGSNSTPDLRDMFIVGATSDDAGAAKSNITGSLLQSSATGVMPAHTHTVGLNNGTPGGVHVPENVTATGTSDTIATSSTGTGTKVIAVFYALAFIMKT